MSRIRIKNFGPIKEGFTSNDGWMEIKKVTVFIGDQASGKSTIAKLVSTFSWIEKALYRGDIDNVASEEFKGEYCSYHRLFDFFKDDTEMFYEGECYYFTFIDNVFEFHPIGTDRQIQVPKIMYVPAERNFLSTVKDADEVKGLPRPLFTFQYEFERSLNELKGSLDLPIARLKLEYDKSFKMSYVVGEGYKIKLLDASSGLHSLVPLFLVTRNLSMAVVNQEKDPSKSELSVRQRQRKEAQIKEMMNQLISEHQSDTSMNEYNKRIALIEAKYVNTRFLNIVEEPEQNLFPKSQMNVLNSLLAYNKYEGNSLILTTHSPYLINYLTLAVKAFKVNANLRLQDIDATQKIAEIVPIESMIDSADLVIYELNEMNGTVNQLDDYKGIPSDENYLNSSLAETNELFAQLQEIEKGWR